MLNWQFLPWITTGFATLSPNLACHHTTGVKVYGPCMSWEMAGKGAQGGTLNTQAWLTHRVVMHGLGVALVIIG